MPRGASCASGATGSMSCRSRHAPGSRRARGSDEDGSGALARAEPSATGSVSTGATSCSAAGSTRVSTSRTLLSALAALAVAGRPDGLAADVPWPPRILVVGASPDDRASVARAAARKGIGESLVYAPALPLADLVDLVRGARAAVLPVVSEAAGLPVIEALACGIPVVASAVGPLPELVGPAGLLVEPRDAGPPRRRAGHDLGRRRASTTRSRASRSRARGREARTWADVARETRAIYAAVGTRAHGGRLTARSASWSSRSERASRAACPTRP